MTDALVLDLVDKGLVTDQIVLSLGYDSENLKHAEQRRGYGGEVTTDYFGRDVPKHAHGTANLGRHTSSSKAAMEAVMELFGRIADEGLLVRRVGIAAMHVVSEACARRTPEGEQLDLFTDYEAAQAQKAEEEAGLEREKKMQHALLEIKKKYGNNAILKGTSFEEGATAKERNNQIGGHKA